MVSVNSIGHEMKSRGHEVMNNILFIYFSKWKSSRRIKHILEMSFHSYVQTQRKFICTIKARLAVSDKTCPLLGFPQLRENKSK